MHFDKLFIQNSIFMGKWRNDKKNDNNNNNVFSPLEGGYWAFEADALAFVSLRNENPRSRLLLQARWGRDLFLITFWGNFHL